MVSTPIQNFSIPRNTDARITVSVSSEVSTDSLVGCSIVFKVYAQQYGIVVDGSQPLIALSTVGGQITIPPSPVNLMEFDVAFAAALTLPLAFGNYYYEATVTDTISNRDQVVLGILAVTTAEN